MVLKGDVGSLKPKGVAIRLVFRELETRRPLFSSKVAIFSWGMEKKSDSEKMYGLWQPPL